MEGPYPIVPGDDRPQLLSVTTLDKLTRARAEAKALGIEVDLKWGLRRLGEEVAAREREPETAEQ